MTLLLSVIVGGSVGSAGICSAVFVSGSGMLGLMLGRPSVINKPSPSTIGRMPRAYIAPWKTGFAQRLTTRLTLASLMGAILIGFFGIFMRHSSLMLKVGCR